MKKLLLACLLLTGCAASFQPFPGASKAELAQTDATMVKVIEAINALTAKVKELDLKTQKAVK